MSTVYEYVRNGQVTERVQPSPAATDIESTRLGVAVLEAKDAAALGQLGDEYWRIAGEEIVNAAPVEPSTPEPVSTPVTPVPAKPAPSKEK